MVEKKAAQRADQWVCRRADSMAVLLVLQRAAPKALETVSLKAEKRAALKAVRRVVRLAALTADGWVVQTVVPKVDWSVGRLAVQWDYRLVDQMVVRRVAQRADPTADMKAD